MLTEDIKKDIRAINRKLWFFLQKLNSEFRENLYLRAKCEVLSWERANEHVAWRIEHFTEEDIDLLSDDSCIFFQLTNRCNTVWQLAMSNKDNLYGLCGNFTSDTYYYNRQWQDISYSYAIIVKHLASVLDESELNFVIGASPIIAQLKTLSMNEVLYLVSTAPMYFQPRFSTRAFISAYNISSENSVGLKTIKIRPLEELLIESFKNQILMSVCKGS